MAELIERYRRLGIAVGEEEFILTAQDTYTFIDELVERSVGILGIDIWLQRDQGGYREILGGLDVSNLVGQAFWIEESSRIAKECLVLMQKTYPQGTLFLLTWRDSNDFESSIPEKG